MSGRMGRSVLHPSKEVRFQHFNTLKDLLKSTFVLQAVLALAKCMSKRVCRAKG